MPLLPYLLLSLQTAAATPPASPDAFAPLSVYNGTWKVMAQHPWGGGPAGTQDTLISRCTRNTAFFTCEQTIDNKPAMLIIYVAADVPGQYHTKYVYPSGLSGNRGDLTISTGHFTYIDKGQNEAGKPTISRTENYFKGPDHIHFEEYESTDDGKTWSKTNEGDETRTSR